MKRRNFLKTLTFGALTAGIVAFVPFLALRTPKSESLIKGTGQHADLVFNDDPGEYPLMEETVREYHRRNLKGNRAFNGWTFQHNPENHFRVYDIKFPWDEK